MPALLLDTVRWGRPMPRLPYLLWGVGLVALKFACDWLVTTAGFGREWNPATYFVAPTESLLMAASQDHTPWYYTCLLLSALPFITAGVLLTARRLRDAGLPVPLVLLFFVPFANLLFFVILCLVPSRPSEAPAEWAGDSGVLDAEAVEDGVKSPDPRVRRVAVVYDRSPRWERLRRAHRGLTRDADTAEAVLALAVTVPLTVGFLALGANTFANYGWGLFVGAPFALGLGSTLIYGTNRPKSAERCFLLGLVASCFTGLAILLLAFEGVICLVMAAPIFFVLTFLGSVVGYALQSRPWTHASHPLILLALLVSVPGLMAAESISAPVPGLLEVTSSVEIDAPPAAVWDLVVAFPPLPEPTDPVFRSGIAYPIRAEIHGTGVGAVRHCVFSTGPFVEPIEVWDEPNRLAFSVSEQPAPMREWSPYDLHPPHLDHYLVSRRGEFRLVPLGGGRTRLEGTTWYTNRMWPAAYWQLWSDALIHRIHLRVLGHIKTLAESERPR